MTQLVFKHHLNHSTVLTLTLNKPRLGSICIYLDKSGNALEQRPWVLPEGPVANAAVDVDAVLGHRAVEHGIDHGLGMHAVGAPALTGRLVLPTRKHRQNCFILFGFLEFLNLANIGFKALNTVSLRHCAYLDKEKT